MWLGLRTIIQAKDALDHILQFHRKLDGPGAAAIPAGRVLILLQFDAECLVHCSHSPGENDRPASRVLFLYDEFLFAGKCLDASDAVGIRAMKLLEFFTAQNGAFRNRFLEFIGVDNRLPPCARAQANCHVYYFVGVSWTYLSRSFQRSALTTSKLKTFLRSRHRSPFCGAEQA